MSALRIALLGAECTGKTTLAQALVARLARDTSLRVTWVPEHLRDWCDAHGRTPLAHEQAAIAHAQHAHIEAAAAAHDVVVCDTTALMTAVYSHQVFGDTSLDAGAVALHNAIALTLVTLPDLPWVADRHQRAGAGVQAPVHARLCELLASHGIAHTLVGGRGEARVAQALGAVRPLLPLLPPA